MRKRFAVLGTFLALGLLVGAAPSAAAKDDVITVNVYHEAVTPLKKTGDGVGTMTYWFIPIAVDGKAGDGQYLTGTLTTLTGPVENGLELRTSNLIFVFGDEPNQLVVGGISLYPSSSATLPPGARSVRPIVGGSGIYDGARGQVVSTNLGAKGWTHVFRIKM